MSDPVNERSGPARHLEPVPAGPGDALADARDRHPSAALDRHVDSYLGAVARELEMRGVIAGPPQRSASATHLSGSIVVDCVAVCPAADDLGHPLPVVVAWDEDHGWVAGLHLDGAASSTRLDHPGLLPEPAEVAEFVVGLARPQPPGDEVPAPSSGPGPRRLRLLR